MRVLEIISLLIILAVPVPLFAQGRSNTSSSGSGASGGLSTEAIENPSSEGGFIGSGRPSAFVGRDEIYNTSSTSSTSSRASNSRRQPATTRSAARTTPQRRATTASAASRSGLTGINNQSVRTVTAIDFDVVIPSPQERLVSTGRIDAGFGRIPGIQDGSVTFRDSPTGTTAVVTGTVASDRARRVAQIFLLLEPGISQVDNRLEIR